LPHDLGIAFDGEVIVNTMSPPDLRHRCPGAPSPCDDCALLLARPEERQL